MESRHTTNIRPITTPSRTRNNRIITAEAAAGSISR
jgi:hypothetical protein